MSTWGQSQFSPAPEASQAAALAGFGSSTFQSPAAISPVSDHGQLLHTSDAVPYASNYLAGVPWEAGPAAALLRQLPQQQQQQSESAGGHWLELGSKHGSGIPYASLAQLHSHTPADGTLASKPHTSGASSSSSKRVRTALNGRRPLPNAGAEPRSPKAATNSPGEAIASRGKGSGAAQNRSPRVRGSEAHPKAGGRVRPAVRSPPRYHEARYLASYMTL